MKIKKYSDLKSINEKRLISYSHIEKAARIFLDSIGVTIQTQVQQDIIIRAAESVLAEVDDVELLQPSATYKKMRSDFTESEEEEEDIERDIVKSNVLPQQRKY